MVRAPIPPCFKCPISLDLMKDPVSLCTGVTYERSSIEKWISSGHSSCPATLQRLRTTDLIPNHTLKRLIHNWCAANRSMSMEDIPCPSPKPALDQHQIRSMLNEVKSLGPKCLCGLKKMRIKAKESARNSRNIAEAGAVPIVASILSSQDWETSEEALATLILLPIDESMRVLISGASLFAALSKLLNRGNLEAKINASSLIDVLATDRELKLAIGGTEGVLKGLVELLTEDLNPMAVKASLRALLNLCVQRRNRVRAVDANAIPALVELLPDAERPISENALAILEILCRCAEGRFAVSQHALAIPAIAKKIFSVSDLATEYAVRTLWAVCQHSPEEGIQRRVVEAGVVSKLMMMLQKDFSSTIKHHMDDLLKLLSNISKHCPDVRLDDALPRLQMV